MPMPEMSRPVHLQLARVTLFIMEANVTIGLGCKEPNMGDNKEAEELSDHLDAMTI